MPVTTDGRNGVLPPISDTPTADKEEPKTEPEPTSEPPAAAVAEEPAEPII